MFKNFFKRLWITPEVEQYLYHLPRFFRVSYTIDANGHSVKLLIRDEDGNRVDFDRYDKRVTGIAVDYQDVSFGGMTYPVDDVVTAKDIPYLKEKFDRFVQKYPISQSTIKARALYDMQCQLKAKIESVTNVVGAYDGKDIVYNLGALPTDARQRVLDVVARFGKDCVSTTLLITVTGSTDEKIGATMDELAMVEADDDAKSLENFDEGGFLVD